jgi:hypothetical protein
VNVTKGRTEAISVGPTQGDGKRRYATVVTPVPPNKLGRLRRKSLDRIKTTGCFALIEDACEMRSRLGKKEGPVWTLALS